MVGAKPLHPPRLAVTKRREILCRHALDNLKAKALASGAVPLALQRPIGAPPMAERGPMRHQPGAETASRCTDVDAARGRGTDNVHPGIQSRRPEPRR